ncbi:MAG: hypothetical protein RBT41_02485 [Clostridia bacterium]|nr:hypothetical protein [Clostridia bacterium]
MRFGKVTGLIFSIFLFVCTPLAAADIQYISDAAQTEKILEQKGDKLFIAKRWYNYTFEINPGKNAAGLHLRQVDPLEYGQALEETAFPLDVLGSYKVYFLDYRLALYPTALALSFQDDSVVVFGTGIPLARARLHRLAVHELGHQIDFKLMDAEKWREYRSLRGLEDGRLYDNAGAVYENRPQEIFAEDFRLLFGGEPAREIPPLNGHLPEPGEVPGLKEFFLGLIPQ